jgi:hypothetical protein
VASLLVEGSLASLEGFRFVVFFRWIVRHRWIISKKQASTQRIIGRGDESAIVETVDCQPVRVVVEKKIQIRREVSQIFRNGNGMYGTTRYMPPRRLLSVDRIVAMLFPRDSAQKCLQERPPNPLRNSPCRL